jgi:hypothetical protein
MSRRLPTVTGGRKDELERTYLTAVPACVDATPRAVSALTRDG